MVGQRCGAAMYGYHESQRVYQTSSRSSWVERGNGHSSLLRSALDVGCESSLVSRSPHPSRNSSHKLAWAFILLGAATPEL